MPVTTGEFLAVLSTHPTLFRVTSPPLTAPKKPRFVSISRILPFPQCCVSGIGQHSVVLLGGLLLFPKSGVPVP